MKTGRLQRYHWGEFANESPELTVPDVVSGLSSHVLGLRGVNASWDSGLLRPSDPGLPPDWTYQGEYAVSPPITQPIADHWPYSGAGFDEWYFFAEVPALFNLNAFCNYLGVSLDAAEGVPFVGGISLIEQLERWAPELVIGQGYNIYVLSPYLEAIQSFARLAREA